MKPAKAAASDPPLPRSKTLVMPDEFWRRVVELVDALDGLGGAAAGRGEGLLLFSDGPLGMPEACMAETSASRWACCWARLFLRSMPIG